MAGTPEFWARTLRAQALKTFSLPIDLDAIVQWCPVKFEEVPLDDCLGVCLRIGTKCGILIKAGQGPGQRRFTIAHELGHFAIPTHATQSQLNYHCVETAVSAPSATSLTEREANTFAAELLMPRAEFIVDIRNRTASIRHVKELASFSRYNVSLTACAIRWVELSLEPRALLCYEHGRLKWQVRSRNFRYYLPARQSEPPVGSAVRDACMKGANCEDPVSAIDIGWLADLAGCDDLLESAVAIPSLDQALCLLEIVPDR